jgi:hypothetical protein
MYLSKGNAAECRLKLANAQRSTLNVQHSNEENANIERPTSNIEHRSEERTERHDKGILTVTRSFGNHG